MITTDLGRQKKMLRLLFIGINCISSVIFVIPAVVILRYAVFRQRNFNRFIPILLFALYVTAVFSVVGIPTAGAFKIDMSFNLIPFIDIVNSPLEYLKNTVLNIVLFIPMGFLLPAVWKDYRSMKRIVSLGLAISAAIELLQLFTFRLTDIDDLITNTAGTAIGYCVSRKFSFRLPLKSADHQEYSIRQEPVIILIIMLLIGIFLKPIVSDGICDIVLSSSWWEKIK